MSSVGFVCIVTGKNQDMLRSWSEITEVAFVFLRNNCISIN